MFEMLINPKRAERKPFEMLFIGLFYASLAFFFVNKVFGSSPVFEKHISLMIVFFTTILSLPFMFYMIRLEEEKDIEERQEKILLKEHGRALISLMYLFLGFVIAFAFWNLVLPDAIVSNSFSTQIAAYCSINSDNIPDCMAKQGITGFSMSGLNTGSAGRFFDILLNNVYVMVFVIIFSLAFGAGAIFILVWNASVIAAAIGITAKNLVSMPVRLSCYMLHGLPEISSYFISALAGGIISIAIIRHDFRSDNFWRVLRDSGDMIILAVIVLVAAAALEVFITPRICGF